MERIGDMVERETVPSPSPGVIGDMTVPGPRRQSGHVGDCPRPPGVGADIPTVLLPGLFRCQGNMLETVLTVSM